MKLIVILFTFVVSLSSLAADIKVTCKRGKATRDFQERLKDPTIDFKINEREIRFTTYAKDKYHRPKNYVSGKFLGTLENDTVVYDGYTLEAYMWDVDTYPQIFVDPKIFEGKPGIITFKGVQATIDTTTIEYICP